MLSPHKVKLVVFQSESVFDKKEAIRPFTICDVKLFMFLDRKVLIQQFQAEENVVIVQIPNIVVFHFVLLLLYRGERSRFDRFSGRISSNCFQRDRVVIEVLLGVFVSMLVHVLAKCSIFSLLLLTTDLVLIILL